MKRKKILFVRTSADVNAPFVQNDIDLLRKHFDIRIVDFIFTKKNLKGTLEGIVTLIAGVFWSDLTFSWFASTHAYMAIWLSKLFRKKAVVVVGGLEVAKIPDINYGFLLNPKSARMVKFILENADRVLTVDDGLKIDAIKNVGVNGSSIQTVALGFNHEKFKPGDEKGKLVITVSKCENWGTVRLKGLDTFVESAKFLPKVRFVVIGIEGDALTKLKNIAPPNVELIGYINQKRLGDYYQKAKVYCQLSLREAFGCSLGEAMLCGCVPVGTNAQGVKTLIGDTGFYVPYDNPKVTADAIEKALYSEKGRIARNRIKVKFTLERREKELITVIDNLLK
ncbi:MAG: glycosyltransferase family 4 protein [Candidatus Altiarchaeota archaeon]